MNSYDNIVKSEFKMPEYLECVRLTERGSVICLKLRNVPVKNVHLKKPNQISMNLTTYGVAE